MSVYMFGGGKGHLPERADRIAMEHGASLVNYVDPGCSCGYGCRPGKCPKSKRHWFTGPNWGEPFDRDMARAVEADLVEAGLIDAATGARA